MRKLLRDFPQFRLAAGLGRCRFNYDITESFAEMTVRRECRIHSISVFDIIANAEDEDEDLPQERQTIPEENAQEEE